MVKDSAKFGLKGEPESRSAIAQNCDRRAI